jgi:preprotein translocase subunit YajC
MSIHAFLAILQDAAQTAGAPPAGAQGPATGQSPPSNPLISLLPMVAIIGIFYFVMIMPERKQRKKREAMLSQVKKGDRVMTTSGMYASVAAINGDEIVLQIDEGVRARFSRAAIQQVLDDGSGEKKDAK